MSLLKHLARAALAWAAANPVKAAQLGLALAVLGTTLYTTRRLDGRALQRIVRALL